MRLLIFISFIFTILQIKAQNSDTYWNYRTRLDNRFLVIGTGQGYSIPAAYNNPTLDIIKWADATIDHGWYVGALATEHYLLKHELNFPDYSNNQISLEENIEALYYALKTLQRLDLNAEISFDECSGIPAENGFFIRDDVPSGFDSHFDNVGNTLSDYLSGNIYDKEMSQDQVYHILLGLSLVRKMIDPSIEFNGINLLEFSESIITNIAQHVIVYSNWSIKNPVCDKEVTRGPYAQGFAYGTNEAIKFVTNNAVNYDDDFIVNLTQNFWSLLGSPTFPLHISSDNTHMIMTIGAVGEVWSGSTIDKLMDLAPLQDFYLYPLLYAGLYDSENIAHWDIYSDELKNIVNDMIIDAPFSGPVSPQPIAGINNWGSNNRFIRKESEHINGGENTFGREFNGLDYMLLYNLNQIVFGCQNAVFTPLSNTQVCNENTDLDLTPNGLPMGGIFSGPGISSDSIFNPSEAGNGEHYLYYSYSMDDNCTSIDSILVNVETCTNTNTTMQNRIDVYPNPFSSEISIKIASNYDKIVKIQLVNHLGKILKNSTFLNNATTNNLELDLSDISDGIYFLIIKSEGNSEVFIKKLIKL